MFGADYEIKSRLIMVFSCGGSIATDRGLLTAIASILCRFDLFVRFNHPKRA